MTAAFSSGLTRSILLSRMRSAKATCSTACRDRRGGEVCGGRGQEGEQVHTLDTRGGHGCTAATSSAAADRCLPLAEHAA
jgi:hypothetical protein